MALWRTSSRDRDLGQRLMAWAEVGPLRGPYGGWYYDPVETVARSFLEGRADTLTRKKLREAIRELEYEVSHAKREDREELQQLIADLEAAF